MKEDISKQDINRSKTYLLDVCLQGLGYGLGMLGVLLGDDGKVVDLEFGVSFEVLKRIFKVQSDLTAG